MKPGYYIDMYGDFYIAYPDGTEDVFMTHAFLDKWSWAPIDPRHLNEDFYTSLEYIGPL